MSSAHANFRTSVVSAENGRARRTTYRRHPISRWYLLPLADVAAAALSPTRLRPWQVTLASLALAVAAASIISLGWFMAAALLVLAAWFCDRLDGKLARRQRTASQLGAWLDANLDELVDVGLHVAVASAAAGAMRSNLPWMLLIAFIAGKYLFFHSTLGEASSPGSAAGSATTDPIRRLYHLPGNADVRVHLLVVMLALGWLTAELAVVAVYYNLRWLARYYLVFQRFRST